MGRNVEVKIRIEAAAPIAERFRAQGAEDRGVIVQTDTYFNAPLRLKLREQEPGRAELIAYTRPDAAGLRTSDYRIFPTADGPGLRETLAAALGVRAVVRKRRHLLMVGRTRVHLDEVTGLGVFLELEVVLREGEAETHGQAEAEELLRSVGLTQAPRIPGSYSDLIAAHTCPGGRP